MARPKTLTARDKKLLSVLAECRVLEIDQVGLVYGVRDYHRARVRVLAERGYVLRRGKYVQISQKGLREVEPDGTVAPIRNDKQRELLAETARLRFALNGWSFTFSTAYKKRVQAVSFARFVAVIEKDHKEYAVYLLLSKPREAGIRKLRQEIAGLPRYNLDNAVVLYAYDQTPDYFGGDPLGLRSLVLLPYPDGVKILNNLDKYHARVRDGFPGCTPCARPFADYEHKDGYISVLVDNDLAKLKYLQDYLKHVQPVEKRRCVGVCLPHQRDELAEMFPNLKLIPLQRRKEESPCKENCTNTVSRSLSSHSTSSAPGF